MPNVAAVFLSLSTAFGLSTSAGLNAYIPLLIVAVFGRLFPSVITFSQPYDALTSWWVIGTLAVLLVIEILVDKIPAADTANDIIHTFIRPAAGAILFAATTDTIGLHPVFAAVLGVILAGSVHTVKAGSRPVVTSLTAGVGSPVMSTIEDTISFVVSLLAILAPYIVAILLLITVGLFTWWTVRRRQRRMARVGTESRGE